MWSDAIIGYDLPSGWIDTCMTLLPPPALHPYLATYTHQRKRSCTDIINIDYAPSAKRLRTTETNRQ